MCHIACAGAPFRGLHPGHRVVVAPVFAVNVIVVVGVGDDVVSSLFSSLSFLMHRRPFFLQVSVHLLVSELRRFSVYFCCTPDCVFLQGFHDEYIGHVRF